MQTCKLEPETCETSLAQLKSQPARTAETLAPEQQSVVAKAEALLNKSSSPGLQKTVDRLVTRCKQLAQNCQESLATLEKLGARDSTRAAQFEAKTVVVTSGATNATVRMTPDQLDHAFSQHYEDFGLTDPSAKSRALFVAKLQDQIEHPEQVIQGFYHDKPAAFYLRGNNVVIEDSQTHELWTAFELTPENRETLLTQKALGAKQARQISGAEGALKIQPAPGGQVTVSIERDGKTIQSTMDQATFDKMSSAPRTPEERWSRAGEIVGGDLTPGEKATIEKAHAVGKGPIYTPEEIQEKANILRQQPRFAKKGVIRKLQTEWITGNPLGAADSSVASGQFEYKGVTYHRDDVLTVSRSDGSSSKVTIKQIDNSTGKVTIEMTAADGSHARGEMPLETLKQRIVAQNPPVTDLSEAVRKGTPEEIRQSLISAGVPAERAQEQAARIAAIEDQFDRESISSRLRTIQPSQKVNGLLLADHSSPDQINAMLKVFGPEQVLISNAEGKLQPLGRRLGSGASAEVYCLNDGCSSVVKISKYTESALKNEVQNQSLLKNAGIPVAEIQSIGSNTKYVIKARVTGPTLESLVSSGQLTDAQARDLAELFKRGESAGLHFDPKADNLLWDVEKKRFVLIDSGDAPGVPVRNTQETNEQWLDRWRKFAFDKREQDFSRFRGMLIDPPAGALAETAAKRPPLSSQDYRLVTASEERDGSAGILSLNSSSNPNTRIGSVTYSKTGHEIEIDMDIANEFQRRGASGVLFNAVLEKNPDVTVIKSYLAKDNLGEYDRLLKEGLSPTDAIKQTPAYKIRARQGFTEIDMAQSHFPTDGGVPILVVKKPATQEADQLGGKLVTFTSKSGNQYSGIVVHEEKDVVFIRDPKTNEMSRLKRERIASYHVESGPASVAKAPVLTPEQHVQLNPESRAFVEEFQKLSQSHNTGELNLGEYRSRIEQISKENGHALHFDTEAAILYKSRLDTFRQNPAKADQFLDLIASRSWHTEGGARVYDVSILDQATMKTIKLDLHDPVEAKLANGMININIEEAAHHVQENGPLPSKLYQLYRQETGAARDVETEVAGFLYETRGASNTPEIWHRYPGRKEFQQWIEQNYNKLRAQGVIGDLGTP